MGKHIGQWGPLPGTGKDVAFDEIAIMTVRDGKVVHQAGVIDNVTGLRQVDAMPAARPRQSPEPVTDASRSARGRSRCSRRFAADVVRAVSVRPTQPPRRARPRAVSYRGAVGVEWRAGGVGPRVRGRGVRAGERTDPGAQRVTYGAGIRVGRHALPEPGLPAGPVHRPHPVVAQPCRSPHGSSASLLTGTSSARASRSRIAWGGLLAPRPPSRIVMVLTVTRARSASSCGERPFASRNCRIFSPSSQDAMA